MTSRLSIYKWYHHDVWIQSSYNNLIAKCTSNLHSGHMTKSPVRTGKRCAWRPCCTIRSIYVDCLTLFKNLPDSRIVRSVQLQLVLLVFLAMMEDAAQPQPPLFSCNGCLAATDQHALSTTSPRIFLRAPFFNFNWEHTLDFQNLLPKQNTSR